MAVLKDLTGQRFGRLTVLSRSHTKNRRVWWNVKCDCGVEKTVPGYTMVEGSAKSCGCLKREKSSERMKGKPSAKRQQYGESSKASVYRMYKRGAANRNKAFDLSYEQFLEITQQECYYCGDSPNTVHACNECYGEYRYNGIDRVDNSKGYAIDNVVACCKTCNVMKMSLSYDEFISRVHRIAERHIMKSED